MSYATPAPPWIFDLEGTLLGFLGSSSEKAKGIILEVEDERIPIALPKRLRHHLHAQQQPGDRVRCIGRSRLDFQTKIVEFEAYQVFFLGSEGKPAPPLSTPAPGELLLPGPPPAKTSYKVLVCSKSDCRKRGGRELLAALNQALAERNLQNRVVIAYTGCQKRCSKAPALTILPGKHRYDRVRLQDLPALLDKHFCAASSH